MDNLEAVHEAESLQDLPGDHFALVLVQLEGWPGDGVEEIAAAQVLGDDAGLVDSLEIFNKIHDKLTLGQFSQEDHLRGRGVFLIRVSRVLELIYHALNLGTIIQYISIQCRVQGIKWIWFN